MTQKQPRKRAKPRTTLQHPPQTRARVIEKFREFGRIDLATHACGVDRTLHYDWLRKYPEYRMEFERAREEVADIMEAEAYRRAVEGVDVPVSIGGKREIIRQYSDSLLMFLLKARNPQVFNNDSITHRGTGPDGSIEVNVDPGEWLRSRLDSIAERQRALNAPGVIDVKPG